jgi:hypothetical protein
MPVQAAGHGVIPTGSPSLALSRIALRLEELGSIPSVEGKVVQIVDHSSLQTCKQRHASCCAFQTGGSSHRESCAVCLGLQERIRGGGTSIDCKFSQPMPEGLFREIHQGGYREGDSFQGGPCNVAAVAIAG